MEPFLSRPLRQRLLGRLERMHEALSRLAHRLREGIASVVGDHAGEAVRDAVQAALAHAAPTPLSPPGPDPPQYGRQTYYDDYPDEPEERRYYDSGRPGGLWRESAPASIPPLPSSPPPRWWSLLPPVLQALACWLRHRPTRRPLLTALAIGATAGVLALAVGPVAGVLAATAGTALTLAGLAEGLIHAVGGLAGDTTDDWQSPPARCH